MKIKSTNAKGNYRLEKSSKEIVFEVYYESWFSIKATLNLEGQFIELIPKNIWCSKFDVFKNHKNKGDIIFNWEGDKIIRKVNEINEEASFLFKTGGTDNKHFGLKDEKAELMFILRPSIGWGAVKYDYDIENI